MKTKTIIILILAGIIATISFNAKGPANETEKAQNETEKPQIETDPAQNETAADKMQAEIKPQEVPKSAQCEKEEVIYFDVPLSHELQDFIFAECETYNIAPAIIISMIEHESQYQADAIGDKGNSIGLMQIQPKWHEERMRRLGCMDLLNPYENIKVAIDFIVELRNINSELAWVLMAYNGGQAHADKHAEAGTISDYAAYVINRSRELQQSIEE